jgi:hypothetical protein
MGWFVVGLLLGAVLFGVGLLTGIAIGVSSQRKDPTVPPENLN